MIPERIRSVLDRLCAAGYDAYLVGGCVRDMLLGREISDYDITTSATPREVEDVFRDENVIETGIAHGTVTVVVDSEPFEITTFRTDGEYLDARHPESVTFSGNVEDDLSRRDFTMNSVAMDRDGNIVDPFGGREDVERGIIRCTGDPDTRFGEDALRIIRALRFSSVLGFEIEKETSDSIKRNGDLLLKISVERVFIELKKLLCGKDAFRVLTEYPGVICAVIPEMAPAVGFDQKNRFHIYDVYTHIAKTVGAIEPDPILRLTMFLHDIGKPYSFTEDPDGTRHFRGHPEQSEKIAREWLARMHADGETIRLISLFCLWHDKQIVPERRPVKRVLSKLTYDELEMLCKIKIADSSAHAPGIPDRTEEAREIIRVARDIIREKECFSLRDLAVNGNDLIALGYEGREIGDALTELLSLVIDEELPNEKEALLRHLKKIGID